MAERIFQSRFVKLGLAAIITLVGTSAATEQPSACDNNNSSQAASEKSDLNFSPDELDRKLLISNFNKVLDCLKSYSHLQLQQITTDFALLERQIELGVNFHLIASGSLVWQYAAVAIHTSAEGKSAIVVMSPSKFTSEDFEVRDAAYSLVKAWFGRRLATADP